MVRLNTIDNKINHIINNEYSYFLNKNNVVGVGFGCKIKSGFNTLKKCIKVFVSHKLKENKLNYKEKIPYIYKGLLTDVEETGYFKFQMLNSKVRPTICGYSIGPKSAEYNLIVGSIGCVVKNLTNIYLLTSGHVLSAMNNLPIGTEIVQPSLLDMGFPGNEIGHLEKYIPIVQSTFLKKPVNLIDCGIIKLNDYSTSSVEIAFIGRPTGINTTSLHDSVFKVGRTSEETIGKVNSINATCEFVYTDKKKTKKFLFKNQIITSNMSSNGDSGAVLVNSKKEILGLLVGSSNSSTIYNNIRDVLNALHVNIVT